MKILSWNVHGLRNPQTVHRLKNKFRIVRPHLLFLMETKVSSKKWRIFVRSVVLFTVLILVLIEREES